MHGVAVAGTERLEAGPRRGQGGVSKSPVEMKLRSLRGGGEHTLFANECLCTVCSHYCPPHRVYTGCSWDLGTNQKAKETERVVWFSNYCPPCKMLATLCGHLRKSKLCLVIQSELENDQVICITMMQQVQENLQSTEKLQAKIHRDPYRNWRAKIQ